MQQRDIESALKNIDFKFFEQMTELQKEQAHKLFRHHYAQQMSKATLQIIKNQKVKEKLQQIEQQKAQELETVQQNIRRKMETYQTNRQKIKEKRQKQSEKYEQFCKQKWEEICRKKRQSKQMLIEKAENQWKETQAYWTLKAHGSAQQKSPTKPTSNKYSSQGYYQQSYNETSPQVIPHRIKHRSYDRIFNKDKKSNIRGDLLVQHGVGSEEDSLGQFKDSSLQRHRLKYQQKISERESYFFQAYIRKLVRIEQKRQSAAQMITNIVEKGKKLRKQRQNPEILERNRRISREQRDRKYKHRISSPSTSIIETGSIPFNPRSLSKTGEKQRRAKSRIDLIESQQKEQELTLTLQKIRATKVQRMVKEAVKQLKTATLNSPK